MPSFSTVVTAAALLAVSVAAPTKQGFTVEQVPRNVGQLTHGAHLVAKTYKKFGKEVPSHVQRAAAAVTGTVTASPEQYDSEYLSPVSVGGQTVNLDFDTGSADLWVFSSSLPASERTGHSIYTPGTTAKRLSGYTWDISYGDGSGARGIVYTDTVNVGGATVTGQAVEAATSISAEFSEDTDTDGLLGLAFSSINTVSPTPQKTFFDNVKASLPSPIVAVNLKKGAVGTYDFGFLDSSKYSGTITYTAITTRQGFWEFTGTGYGVGSGAFVSSSIDAIADTGTTLIYAPSAVVTAYYRSVSGASNSATYGGYVFPCSATLPSLTLGIGSYRAVVPGTYLNYAPVTTGSSTCFGGLQSSAGIGINIYGDVFLKSQYVVFDNSATPRLGVAAKA